jgi:hypothetical protein
LTLLLILLPWTFYQKLYEPPGNRLVKWHIGGVIDIADQRSTLDTIVEQYRDTPPDELIKYKQANFQTLIQLPLFQIQSPAQERSREFFHTFNAFGILNLGWFILLVASFFKRLRQRLWPTAGTLLAIALVSLGVWGLAMFGPGTTAIHQGSYATMMLLITGLSITLTALPDFLIFLMLGLHSLFFLNVWIISTYTLEKTDYFLAPLNLGAVSLAIAGGLFCGFLLWRSQRNTLVV